MGANFDTRGRITIKGIERCTSEDEFLFCQSVGCYTLPFATDGGQAPTGETDPFLR